MVLEDRGNGGFTVVSVAVNASVYVVQPSFSGRHILFS